MRVIIFLVVVAVFTFTAQFTLGQTSEQYSIYLAYDTKDPNLGAFFFENIVLTDQLSLDGNCFKGRCFVGSEKTDLKQFDLARKISRVRGVTSVFIESGTMGIKKSAVADWQKLLPQIAEIIGKELITDKQLFRQTVVEIGSINTKSYLRVFYFEKFNSSTEST